MNLGKLMDPVNTIIALEPVIIASSRFHRETGRGFISKDEIEDNVINPDITKWDGYIPCEPIPQKVLELKD
ncbi:MAG TPA: hypothetical protein VN131_05440 [Mobilitalea sp.]|nr:hypothetical protein [Mobilitalea sp.]